MENFHPDQFAAFVIVLFFAVGIHEYCHCKFADMAGDPTPRIHGRVTLNLFKHFEPLGTLMILITSLTGFGFGWGRPAPMDPRRMRHPRGDFFIAVVAGPFSNVVQAIAYAVAIRLVVLANLPVSGFVAMVLELGTLVNLALALFNLIPFGPLDGQWLVGLMLPEKPRYYWFRFHQRVGMFGLLGLALIANMSHIDIWAFLYQPVTGLARLLTGINF